MVKKMSKFVNFRYPLKVAWFYSLSFCIAVYFGWHFGLQYFGS